MTRDDALTVLGLLNAGFPSEALEEPTVALWLAMLMEMADAEAATNAALAIVKTGQRFPSIADFRQVYRVHVELEAKPALQTSSTASRDVPDWVLVWRWLRFMRDPVVTTPLPQQKPNHQPPYLSEEDYRRYHGEWIAAGCPGRNLRPEEVVPAAL